MGPAKGGFPATVWDALLLRSLCVETMHLDGAADINPTYRYFDSYSSPLYTPIHIYSKNLLLRNSAQIVSWTCSSYSLYILHSLFHSSLTANQRCPSPTLDSQYRIFQPRHRSFWQLSSLLAIATLDSQETKSALASVKLISFCAKKRLGKCGSQIERPCD